MQEGKFIPKEKLNSIKKLSDILSSQHDTSINTNNESSISYKIKKLQDLILTQNKENINPGIYKDFVELK